MSSTDGKTQLTVSTTDDNLDNLDNSLISITSENDEPQQEQPSEHHMIDALLSYVPGVVAEFYISHPELVGSPNDMHRQDFSAVVMFADMSGFTALTESLQKKGQEGAELLKSLLNNVFGRLIRIIVNKYKGDLIKFAGDAVLVMWQIESEPVDTPPVTAHACECALELVRAMDSMKDHQVGDAKISLGLHVGLGVGRVQALYVGGVRNRRELMVFGDPLADMGRAEQLSKRGDVVISPAIYDILVNHGYIADSDPIIVGPGLRSPNLSTLRRKGDNKISSLLSSNSSLPGRRPIANTRMAYAGMEIPASAVPARENRTFSVAGLEDGYFLISLGDEITALSNTLHATSSTLTVSEHMPAATTESTVDSSFDNMPAKSQTATMLADRFKQLSPEDSERASQCMQAYIPGAMRSRLHYANSHALGEFRRVTVLFVNIMGLVPQRPLDIHKCFCLVQQYMYLVEGSVNKFLMDDKGVTAVCALGIPPLQHPNDAALAVKGALMLVPALEQAAPNIKCAVGITSGRVYCGEVGSFVRREYTLMGAVVNLSARLMQKAVDLRSKSLLPGACILCDDTTMDVARSEFVFRSLGTLPFKGIAKEVSVWQPDGPLKNKLTFWRPPEEPDEETRQDLISQDIEEITGESSVFVGRDEEMQRATSAIESVVSNTRPQCNTEGSGAVAVVVTGDPGVGKTAFMRQMRVHTLQKECPHAWVDCLSTNRESNLHVWAHVVWQALGLSLDRFKPSHIDEDVNSAVQKIVGADSYVQVLKAIFHNAIGADHSAPRAVDAVATIRTRQGSTETLSPALSALSSTPTSQLGMPTPMSPMLIRLPTPQQVQSSNQHILQIDGLPSLNQHALCIIDVLRLIVAETRLVVFFGDTHWMDDLSWQVCAQLVSDSAFHGRLAIVLSLTSEAVLWQLMNDTILQSFHAITTHPNTVRVDLQPLDDDAITSLLIKFVNGEGRGATVLGPAYGIERGISRIGTFSQWQIDSTVLDFVKAKAQGNPYFAEEVIRGLLRDKYIIKSKPHKACVINPNTHLTDFCTPDSVQSMVLSQIEGLTPSQQLIVRACATFGRISPVEGVLSILENEPFNLKREALKEDLNVLRDSHILITTQAQQKPSALQTARKKQHEVWWLLFDNVMIADPRMDVCEFPQVIVQEVVYDNMLFDLRRQMHLHVASWLDTYYLKHRFPDRSHALAAIGYHSRFCGHFSRAAQVMEEAGLEALKHHQHSIALWLLGQALDIHSLQLRVYGVVQPEPQPTTPVVQPKKRFANFISRSTSSPNQTSNPTKQLRVTTANLSITADRPPEDQKYGEVTAMGYLRCFSGSTPRPQGLTRARSNVKESSDQLKLNLYFWRARVLMAIAQAVEQHGADMQTARDSITQCLTVLGKDVGEEMELAKKSKSTVKYMRDKSKLVAPRRLSQPTLFTPTEGNKTEWIDEDERLDRYNHDLRADAYITFAAVWYAMMDQTKFCVWARKAVRKVDKHIVTMETEARARSVNLLATVISQHSKSLDERIKLTFDTINDIMKMITPATRSFCLSIFAVVHSGFGQWLEAEHLLSDSVPANDPSSHMVARATIILAVNEFLQGKYAQAQSTFEQLREFPLKPYQLWYHVGNALGMVVRDEPSAVIAEMASIRQELFLGYQHQIKPIVTAIEALAHWRLYLASVQQQNQNARTTTTPTTSTPTTTTTTTNANIPPNSPSSPTKTRRFNEDNAGLEHRESAIEFSFAAIDTWCVDQERANAAPLDYKMVLALWCVGEVLSGCLNTDAASRVSRHVVRLVAQFKEFSHVYPIAKPFYKLFNGRCQLADRKQKRSPVIHSWTKALDRANHLHMAGVAASLRFEIAANSPAKTDRLKNVDQVLEEFEKLGATASVNDVVRWLDGYKSNSLLRKPTSDE